MYNGAPKPKFKASEDFTYKPAIFMPTLEMASPPKQPTKIKESGCKRQDDCYR